MLTPTTCARLVTSGPPELPGLSAASVWIRFSIRRTVRARKRSAERADHAGGHRVLKAKRIADRDHQLARTQRGRIAERRRDQIRRRDAQNGEIRVRIVTDEVRHEIPAVWQRHADARRLARRSDLVAKAGDDVTVGEDEAVGREDESRSRAARIHFDDRWTDEVHGRDHRL